MKRFQCKLCNYDTNKKSTWESHIISKKHQMNIIIVSTLPNKCTCGKSYKHISSLIRHQQFCDSFTCICGKSYKHISSLSRHRQKCKKYIESMIKYNHDANENENECEMKSMYNEIIENNQKLQKQINILSTQPRIVQHKVNIYTFLNNNCKRAMNLSEFIQSYPTTFEHLECIEKYGYTQGMQHTIISSLKEMERCERPIHCMDAKRKLFYVKDNNIWDKDKNLSKISTAINQFNTQQLNLLHQWMNQNPYWIATDKYQDKINKIINELTSLYENNGHKVKKKIVMDIMNATMLDDI